MKFSERDWHFCNMAGRLRSAGKGHALPREMMRIIKEELSSRNSIQRVHEQAIFMANLNTQAQASNVKLTS